MQLDRLEPVVTRPTDRAEYAEAQGVLDLLLGSPRDALAHLETALDGHRISYGADHPSTVAVLQLQGDAYRLAGDFPAAIAAYRETLRLRLAVLGTQARRDGANPERDRRSAGRYRGLGERGQRFCGGAPASCEETPGGEERVDTITVRTNRALARWGSAKNRAAADQYAVRGRGPSRRAG